MSFGYPKPCRPDPWATTNFLEGEIMPEGKAHKRVLERKKEVVGGEKSRRQKEECPGLTRVA